MIYWGLRRYGYRELASLVAHATQRLVQKSGNREYYDAETGAGCGLDPFWSWSLLAHFMPYEEANEVDVAAIWSREWVTEARGRREEPGEAGVSAQSVVSASSTSPALIVLSQRWRPNVPSP